jgi:CelD/BcsL family acetyltransferase involved in cellulose biosynthesis
MLMLRKTPTRSIGAEAAISIGLPLAADATDSAPRSLPLQHEIKVCDDLTTFRALREQWENLAEAATHQSLCLTWPYCELAAQFAFENGARIAVVIAHDGLGLSALWPLAIYREGLLRVARPLSCGSNDEYGVPLVHSRTGSKALPELLRAALGVRADILEVRFVRMDSAFQQALERLAHSWLRPAVPARLRELPGYLITLKEFERWEDYSATLSRSLQAKMRAHLRQLAAHGRPEFGWCNTAEDAEAVLTWLFANKQRWAISRGFNTHYLMDERARDFFIALARRMDLSKTPLVAYLKLDGRPVAASVNLLGRDVLEGFITTYDEALGACSPGHLLQEFCVKWAHANSRDFDLRPFYAAYKARWANHITRHETHTVFLSMRGRLAEFTLLSGYMTRVLRVVRKYVAATVCSVNARVSRSR